MSKQVRLLSSLACRCQPWRTFAFWHISPSSGRFLHQRFKDYNLSIGATLTPRRTLKYSDIVQNRNIFKRLISETGKRELKDIEVAISQFSTSSNIDDTKLLEDLSSNNKLNPKQRLKLLSETWDQLNKKLVLLNERHFILRLQCYNNNNNNKFAPKLFLNEVKEAGLEPSEKMLKLLLAVVAEHGDQGYVSSVVNSMKSRNFPADDYVFSSLIIAHAVRGDMTSARQILDTMRESKVKPGPLVFTALMRAAVLDGDYSALHTAKTMASDSGVLLSSSHIITVLDTILRSGKQHLVSSLQSNVKACSRESLTALLESLVFSGVPAGGFAVLKLLLEEGDAVQQCNDFIQLLFSAATPLNRILDICGEMVTEKTHNRALYDVLETILREKSLDEGLLAMSSCKKFDMELRPHLFWPLFVSSCRLDGEQGVYKILQEMADLDVKPDVETLTDMVLPRLTLDESTSALQRLRDVTNLPLSQLLSPYVSQLVKIGILQDALSLCTRYKESVALEWLPTLQRSLVVGYRVNRDHVTAVQLLKEWGVKDVGDWLISLLTAKKWMPTSDVVTLLKELNGGGMVISKGDERWLHRKLSQAGSLTPDVEKELRGLVQPGLNDQATSPAVFHPEKMNLEQLECHVIELESKGMNTRGALRKLLQAYCRAGNSAGANRAYKKLLEGGMADSPGILSSMIEVYTKSGAAGDASNVFRDIKTKYPAFGVDAYKIVDLATLLVNDGKIEDAYQILDTHPQKSESRKRLSDWERNCWELLTAAAKQGGAAVVERLLQLLLRSNYCVPTNVVLGPLVRAYLDGGDVEGAVREFCRCSGELRKTPLQQEVMTATLAAGNSELLEEVVTAATRVHGVGSTQAVLVVALALHGDVDGLRQIFQNEKAELSSSQLRQQLERACSLGQVAALKCLLHAVWKLPTADSDYLIALILQYYHRKGDSEGAVGFWAELERVGIPISDQHKSSLASLVAAT